MPSLSFAGSLRSTLAAVAVASFMVAASGCDTTDDTALNVFVADFSFAPGDFDPRESDLNTQSYDARDARVVRGNLADALRTAGDGAMVMAYIDAELVSNIVGADGNRTWTPLPVTRSFEESVLARDENGDFVQKVVGFTASYEYSFDNQDFYFDVVSSAEYTDFGDDRSVLFDFIVPQRVAGGPDDIDLRLVVIPNELYYTAQAGARIDLRDYEAVKAAYGLPD